MPPQNPLDPQSTPQPQNPEPVAQPAPQPLPPTPPVEPAAPPVIAPQAPAAQVAPDPAAPQQPVTPVGQAASFNSQPAGSGGGKKTVIIIVVIVVVLLILVGGSVAAFLLMRSSGSGSGSGTGVSLGSLTKPKDVFDRPDGTLELQPLIDEQDTITAQDLTGKLNQQINLSNGLSFMVTKVERNWVSTAKYDQPDAGKEFVRVHMVVGNRTQSGSISNRFELQNAAGGRVKDEFIAESALPDQLSLFTSIDPGNQKTGSMVFQVNKDETPISLVYNTEYTKIGDSDDKAVALRASVPL